MIRSVNHWEGLLFGVAEYVIPSPYPRSSTSYLGSTATFMKLSISIHQYNLFNSVQRSIIIVSKLKSMMTHTDSSHHEPTTINPGSNWKRLDSTSSTNGSHHSGS